MCVRVCCLLRKAICRKRTRNEVHVSYERVWLAKKALVSPQVGLVHSGQRRVSWREHGLLDFRWEWTKSARALTGQTTLTFITEMERRENFPSCPSCLGLSDSWLIHLFAGFYPLNNICCLGTRKTLTSEIMLSLTNHLELLKLEPKLYIYIQFNLFCIRTLSNQRFRNELEHSILL